MQNYNADRKFHRNEMHAYFDHGTRMEELKSYEKAARAYENAAQHAEMDFDICMKMWEQSPIHYGDYDEGKVRVDRALEWLTACDLRAKECRALIGAAIASAEAA